MILIGERRRRTAYLLSDGGVIRAVRAPTERQRAEALHLLQLSVVGDVPQIDAGVCKVGGRGLHLQHTGRSSVKTRTRWPRHLVSL